MCDARTRKYRAEMFQKQQQRCFYCGFPMWLKRPVRFATRYGIAEADALRFKCTAEHLDAICDGGTSRRENIVAACRWCNQHRHQFPVPPKPHRYLRGIQKQIARGAWHPHRLHKMLALAA